MKKWEVIGNVLTWIIAILVIALVVAGISFRIRCIGWSKYGMTQDPDNPERVIRIDPVNKRDTRTYSRASYRWFVMRFQGHSEEFIASQAEEMNVGTEYFLKTYTGPYMFLSELTLDFGYDRDWCLQPAAEAAYHAGWMLFGVFCLAALIFLRVIVLIFWQRSRWKRIDSRASWKDRFSRKALGLRNRFFWHTEDDMDD